MEEQRRFKDTDLTSEQIYEMFNEQWDFFATLAYGGYLKEGRGAVCANVGGAKIEGRNMGMVTIYFSEEKLQGLKLDEEPRSWIKTYDPEKSVVILMKMSDNSINSLMITKDEKHLSPKYLYEEMNKEMKNKPVH